MSDDNGLVWPENISPFKVGIINLKSGNNLTDKACEDMYAGFQKAGVEAFYDDRDASAGVKFADMDLIGLPWQMVVGPKGIANGIVELKNRSTGEKSEVPFEEALKRFAE